MKRGFLFAILSCLFTIVSGQEIIDSTMQTMVADNVIVGISDKETIPAKERPASVSFLPAYKINQRRIENIKDISMIVPNVFIPDYGSRQTMPVYIRGIGSRSGNQSIAFYVDNVSYFDKSSFDFDFQDIKSIEILRGPNSTLYGRNAMGGIISVQTLSPFEWQGTKVRIGAGNYGLVESAVSVSQKVSDKLGISFSLNGNSLHGYFYNTTRDERADKKWNAGARLKIEYKFAPKWKVSLIGSYNHTDQKAFPYGYYDIETGKIQNPAFNDEGSYWRRMSNNSLRFEYKSDRILFTSNTGYQWLDDDMNMDQDFINRSIFTLNQSQIQNSINQEFNVRNIDEDRNYYWSAGFSAFYNSTHTNSLVTFKEDGIKEIIQPIFDNLLPPYLPFKLTVANKTLPNPGVYNTPSYGFALYHQSTIKNLFTDGLSLTMGVRLDYEKQYLNYDTEMSMSIKTLDMIPPIELNKRLDGALDQDFFKFQPKISLQYSWNQDVMAYISVTNGYKAGGYNIQMFSEVIQDSMKTAYNGKGAAASPEISLKDVVAYKPETTWNFEGGTKFSLLDGKLKSEIAVFYMDIRDIQLTKFVGSGRILTNAGKARSFGGEISMSVSPFKNFSCDLAYGYTNSKFTDYDQNDGITEDYDPTINYKGKYVPYAPSHTLSVGAAYNINFNGWFSNLLLSAQFTGAGKIYWTEKNDLKQPFYGLLNAQATLRSKWLQLSVWGKNLTSSEYGAFYFESFGRNFIQRGKPLTFGATVSVIF